VGIGGAEGSPGRRLDNPLIESVRDGEGEGSGST